MLPDSCCNRGLQYGVTMEQPSRMNIDLVGNHKAPGMQDAAVIAIQDTAENSDTMDADDVASIQALKKKKKKGARKATQVWLWFPRDKAAGALQDKK